MPVTQTPDQPFSPDSGLDSGLDSGPVLGHDQPSGPDTPAGIWATTRPDPDDLGLPPSTEVTLHAALVANLTKVRSDIAAAADAQGRPEPELIAVTKSVPAAVALALHRLGCEHLAENRAPTFLEKADAFLEAGLEPTWHFVGHVQRNKARRILERAHVLHSVDSVRLAETIARVLGELDRPVDLFLEVNLTGEKEKHGLTPDELPAAIEALGKASQAQILGLMVMGPLKERGQRTTDDVFADAQRLAADVERTHAGSLIDGICRLSMGMSGDLQPAIVYGSTHVRIGSSLFHSIPPLGPSQ